MDKYTFLKQENELLQEVLGFSPKKKYIDSENRLSGSEKVCYYPVGFIIVLAVLWFDGQNISMLIAVCYNLIFLGLLVGVLLLVTYVVAFYRGCSGHQTRLSTKQGPSNLTRIGCYRQYVFITARIHDLCIVCPPDVKF